MATWSSFEKDKLLAENWRKFVKDNPEDKSSQTVFGINSEDNPESLKSFLKKNQGAIGLTPEQVEQLVALMLAQTKEDDVVLEAIGGPQRDARTFSSDTTTKLNALINTFQLSPANKKKLEKVLNRWAKLNTVSFEQGAPATPVVPEYEPDEDEQASTEKPKGIDYEPYGATDATPEKRADNLVVKQKGNFDAETGLPISKEGRDSIINQIAGATKQKEFYLLYQKLANSKFSNNDKKDSFNTAFRNNDYRYLSGFGAGPGAQQTIRQKFIDLFLTDEEEAETDRIKPVSSTEPAEQPDEKTVSTDTARPKRGRNKRKEKEETPSEVITRMLQGKGVNKRKINAFIEDIKALRKIEEAKKTLLQTKLGLKDSEYKKFKTKHKDVIKLINRLGTNKTKFIEAVAKLIAQPAPTRQEPEAPTPDTSAEPTPEPENTESDPIKELESYIEKAKDKPESYIEIIDNFRNKYKQLVGELNPADIGFSEEIQRLIKKLKSEDKTDKDKSNYISDYINEIKQNFEEGLSIQNGLNIFEKVVKPIQKYLLSNTEPEPARQEEEPKQKTTDPTFTRRTTKRIKDYYNGLKIREKLPYRFNTWKKPIEKLNEVQSIEIEEIQKNKKLFVITLTDGQQFGLPFQADVSNLTFAFTPESTHGVSARLKNVLKLAKIKDGEIVEKGLIDYYSALEESLMLRWKTIAGIK